MAPELRALCLGASLMLACGGSGHSGSQQATSSGSSGHATSASDAAASTSAEAVDAAATDAIADDGGTGFLAPPTGPQAQQVAQLYTEATQAFARNDFQTAAATFRRAYDLYPAPESAWNAARAYERMGEVNDAIRYFEIVRHGHPSAAQVTDIDRREAALRAYEQRRRDGIAQTLPSSDALSQEGNTWFQRGVTLYRRRQYPQAQLAFEAAQNYIQTPQLNFNLAVTYEAQHNYTRALEYMREYLQSVQGTAEEAGIQQRIHQLEQQ